MTNLDVCVHDPAEDTALFWICVIRNKDPAATRTILAPESDEPEIKSSRKLTANDTVMNDRFARCSVC